jgi:fermentation-respiration switch protein FrsA (DUF1100 family)
MDRAAHGALLALVVTCVAAGVTGCGGGSQKAKPATDRFPFAYRRSRPLSPSVRSLGAKGPVNVRSVTYTTADGSRVPALLAVPRHGKVKGCLMYQPGLGSPKETAAPLWPGAAQLGLAVFTIDPRYTGARASTAYPTSRVLDDTALIVSTTEGNVIDLRRGIDYLDGLAICRHNIGYMGTSMGGILGALLAGADQRIRAAVLSSVGATWRARLFYSGTILPGVANDPKRLAAALQELSPLDPARWIAKVAPRPVMIVDGLADPNVPVIDALNLSAAAQEPKTLVLHKGGHDPFGPPDGAHVASQVASFLSQNLASRSAP